MEKNLIHCAWVPLSPIGYLTSSQRPQTVQIGSHTLHYVCAPRSSFPIVPIRIEICIFASSKNAFLKQSVEASLFFSRCGNYIQQLKSFFFFFFNKAWWCGAKFVLPVRGTCGWGRPLPSGIQTRHWKLLLLVGSHSKVVFQSCTMARSWMTLSHPYS